MQRSLNVRQRLLLAALVGSVWGVTEVVLGGMMKMHGIPLRGDILTGLGIGLIALGMAISGRTLIGLVIAIFAVACKQLVLPLISLPISCRANSALAVLLAGGVLTAVTSIAGTTMRRRWHTRAVIGGAGGLGTAISFYFLGMRVAPCPYLLSFNRPGGLMAFMLREALIWAILAACLFPLGYALGLRIRHRIVLLPVRRPLLYYISTISVILACWIASAFAIASGL